MKRPAFQFYPADWRKDMALQSCSVAARGLWIDMLCIAHECEPYGHLVVNGKPMTPAQIGRHSGLTERECAKLLDELMLAGVSSVTEDGAIYSRRMVRDEDIRNRRAAGGEAGKDHGSKGAEHGKKGGRPPNGRGVSEPPKEPPPSSSSSSSPSGLTGDADASPVDGSPPPTDGRPALTLVPPQPELPDCPHQELISLYRKHLPHLRQPLRWDGERAESMRTRWRECSKPSAFGDGYRTREEGLAFWDRFFAYVASVSKLRDGITSHEGGQQRVWKPDLAWLIGRSNFTKVIEGAYA